MKRFKQFCSLALLAASVASAAPDCNWSGRWSNRPTDQADNIITYKTNGSTPVPGLAVNNTATGCSAWIMIVDVEGFSAFSVELDTAPTASPGVPGTWSNSNLTTSSGSNPTTSSPSTYLATGYYPFFRVNVTTVTGTPGSINVQVFGWRSQAYLSASNGHLTSSPYNTALNLAFGTGAGTSPTLLQAIGTDVSQTIQFISGSSPAATAAILTVTYATPFPNGSNCVLNTNDNTILTSFTQLPYVGSSSATAYTLTSTSTALSGSTFYGFAILCIGY